METSGVLYIAAGAKYIRAAMRSAESVREHCPGLATHLNSGGSVASALAACAGRLAARLSHDPSPSPALGIPETDDISAGEPSH